MLNSILDRLKQYRVKRLYTTSQCHKQPDFKTLAF